MKLIIICSQIIVIVGGGANNLVSNLGNTSKYVLHYKILQLYLSLEMKLTKIIRILIFKQLDWLKSTLILCKRKRKWCKHFRKNFLKKLILIAFMANNGRFKENNKC